MDTLDFFGVEEEKYRASLWLYESAKGVRALGGLHETVEEAQAALEAYSQEALAFTPVEGHDLAYASRVWKEGRNVAVVYRESGSVMCEAPLPEGWFPPGDPRRVKSAS
jgi:hypothetical protein